MTKEEHIEKLQGFLDEIMALGEFNTINTVRLKHINNRYVTHLFTYEDSQGRDSIQTIIFSTEERTKEIRIANSGGKTKKELAINATRYYSAIRGLMRDVQSRIDSL